ncbi:hypothetical protein BJX63DRAFT_442177 [Aspergillus granulosus]|uniref:PRISE-like Rossmann-fold domain-containing protein n=1 Tax=Aspergillus granulosus TaxID=176169 RepID=A0ABR4GR99_9EURO
MVVSESNVTLVFGASGISGWAVTKNLLSYPTSTTFSRVIALTHRPRTVQGTGLPEDPRLELYSGIYLRSNLQGVEQQMQSKIPNLDEITHVYYLAYANATAYMENVMEIRNINVGMTLNAVHACDQLCRQMKFFLLQTGTNNYGVAVFRYMDKIEISPPLREDQPRIPSPWGDEIFYYPQVNLIKEAAKGKQWPARIRLSVRHVPAVTSMTYVEPLALYLSLYRYINGPGATVPFPGTKKNFVYTYTDSSQDIITRAEIYLSVMQPEAANGEAFSIADTATPGPWSAKWPILAENFGLKGTGPGEHGESGWGYRQVMCEEYGLKQRTIEDATWVFVKADAVGFTEELPVGQGHINTFDRIAVEKIIPPKSAWVPKQ